MTKKLVFLTTDQDFNQFRQSKLFNSKNFRLRVRFNTNQNTPRFGFIIPKKVMIKVSDRNKVKRRLKSILQKYATKIRGADFLLLPNKSALTTKFTDLETEFLSAVQGLRLWKS